MREIKFRAWDKEVSQMILVNTLHLDSMKVLKIDDTWDWYKRDRVIMQYTGLKDKNGVEIYEGDLVDMDARVHGIHGYRQVEFKDGAFGIRPMNKNDEELWWACVWNMNCEVIGNIYTHPSLGSEKE